MEINDAIKFYLDAETEPLEITGGHPPDVDSINGVVGIATPDDKGGCSIAMYDECSFIDWIETANDRFRLGQFETKSDALWETHGDFFE